MRWPIGVVDTSLYVITGDVRVVVTQDVVKGGAVLQQLQHGVDGDARAFDARLAEVDVGVDCDARLIHNNFPRVDY